VKSERATSHNKETNSANRHPRAKRVHDGRIQVVICNQRNIRTLPSEPDSPLVIESSDVSPRVWRRAKHFWDSRSMKGVCFKPSTILAALVLLSLGFAAGMFFRGPGLPRAMSPFGACASGRQFLVEFRTDRVYSTHHLLGMPVYDRGDIMLEVDGAPIGVLSTDRHPVRRFFCEGNHLMRITFANDNLEKQGQQMNHSVDFALSRSSVFYVTERGTTGSGVCVSYAWCPVMLRPRTHP